MEMAVHINGAALYLIALIGGKFVTQEQTREWLILSDATDWILPDVSIGMSMK